MNMKLKSCIKCGSTNIEICEGHKEHWFVICMDCPSGFEGIPMHTAVYDTKELAIEAWNKLVEE